MCYGTMVGQRADEDECECRVCGVERVTFSVFMMRETKTKNGKVESGFNIFNLFFKLDSKFKTFPTTWMQLFRHFSFRLARPEDSKCLSEGGNEWHSHQADGCGECRIGSTGAILACPDTGLELFQRAAQRVCSTTLWYQPIARTHATNHFDAHHIFQIACLGQDDIDFIVQSPNNCLSVALLQYFIIALKATTSRSEEQEGGWFGSVQEARRPAVVASVESGVVLRDTCTHNDLL
jgi:hypothetical protein